MIAPAFSPYFKLHSIYSNLPRRYYTQRQDDFLLAVGDVQREVLVSRHMSGGMVI